MAYTTNPLPLHELEKFLPHSLMRQYPIQALWNNPAPA